jgi:glycosyltransferase involved in cell wall biosynthesis
MNVWLENVNLESNSGPNSFAKKLVKYLPGTFDKTRSIDVALCFIESHRENLKEYPLIQRLDGIYFNTRQNYKKQNENIKRTYDAASGVIFQSEFNKQLSFRHFGKRDNCAVIHNGADLEMIENSKPISGGLLDSHDKLWCCASSWRPHKRLEENIRYFLEHSGEKDLMIVAGDKRDVERHPRVKYAGNLSSEQLIALYKASSYFVHLAWLDHCPNVVVDARASGCKIICSSSGGTKEIAGSDAIVIEEEEWNFEPVELYNPPLMDFSRKIKNNHDSDYNMASVAEQYKKTLGRGIHGLG